MSLINEALKKAQKLRTGDPAGTVPPMAGGDTRVTKRAQPRSAQQLLILASGGLVLVVLSVIITFWLVNRVPAEKSGVKPIATKSSDASGPAPVIVPPVIKAPVVAETPLVQRESPPAPKEKPTPPPSTVATAPTSKSASPAANAPAPAPKKAPEPVAPPMVTPRADPVVDATEPRVTAQPPPASSTAPAPLPPASTAVATTPPDPAAPPPAAPPKQDDRVHAFVDAIKVAGIRSSGGDSRVLMNDRVFRVNDIVDRNFGLRLSKVAPDALTFTDANGAVYVKNF